MALFIAPADQTANFRNWKNSIVVKIASTSVFADGQWDFFLGGGEVNRTGAPFLRPKINGWVFVPPLWMAKKLMIGRCNFLLVVPSFKGDMLVSRKVPSKRGPEQVHHTAVWKELEYPWVFSFSLAGGVGTFAFFPRCLILTLPTRREKQHRPD